MISDSELIDLGAPALIEGESETEFRALLERVMEAVAPRDMLESIWTREVVDVTWEVRRLRALKAPIVRAGYAQALRDLLPPEMEYYQDQLRCVDEYLMGNAETKTWFDDRLAQLGVSMDDLAARAYAAQLEHLERIDRMLGQAETRRRLLLLDIDRRRDAFATRLRDSIKEVDAAPAFAPRLASNS